MTLLPSIESTQDLHDPFHHASASSSYSPSASYIASSDSSDSQRTTTILRPAQLKVLVSLTEEQKYYVQQHPTLSKVPLTKLEEIRSLNDPDIQLVEPNAQRRLSTIIEPFWSTAMKYDFPSREGYQDVVDVLHGLGRLLRERDDVLSTVACKALLKAIDDSDDETRVWDALLYLSKALIPPTPSPIQRSRSSSVEFKRIVQRKTLQRVPFSSCITTPDPLSETSLGFRDCKFLSVEGFFDKFFEQEPFQTTSKGIFDQLQEKGFHLHGRWTNFPSVAAESNFFRILESFQKQFLHASRRHYHFDCKMLSQSHRNMKQIDVLLKISDSVSDLHHYDEVAVLGTLRHSARKNSEAHVQLGMCARETFIAQPARRFVHAFSLCGDMMRAILFDRAGTFSSTSFSVHRDPRRLVLLLTAYSMMTDEQYGLDQRIRRSNEDMILDVQVTDGSTMRSVRISPHPLSLQTKLISGGTSCHEAYDTQDWQKVCIIKLSWPRISQPVEWELLRRAEEHRVQGIVRCIHQETVTSTAMVRKGLDLEKASRSARQISERSSTSAGPSSPLARIVTSTGSGSLSEVPMPALPPVQVSAGMKRLRSSIGSDDAYGGITEPPRKQARTPKSVVEYPRPPERELRIMVTEPKGQRLEEFDTPLTGLSLLRDAVLIHQGLLEKAKILHRDISFSNIMIVEDQVAGTVRSMLIDLDHAIVIGDSDQFQEQYVGTPRFMAVEILRQTAKHHTYRHDLESFFYVLLWMLIRELWTKTHLYDATISQPPDLLREWNFNDRRDLAKNKEQSVTLREIFEDLIQDIPPVAGVECLRDLCRDLREILFLSYGAEKSRRFATPGDKEPSTLYNSMIAAFDKAIANLAAAEAIV